MKNKELAAAMACLLVGQGAWAQFDNSVTGQNIEIIGGREVVAGSAVAASTVAVVSFKQTAKGTSMGTCTGSLLAADLVVTAAHCVDPSADQRVVAFRRSLKGQGLIVSAGSAMIHPSYASHAESAANAYDIALIRIDTQLPAGFAPADLLEDPSALEAGRQVTLAGFGTTTGDPTAGDTSGILRETKIRIADPNYSETEVLLDQSHGKGACHGDSGGPAFVQIKGKLKLFGVTSRGQGDGLAAECGQNVVYTNILAHLGFLNEAAKALRGEK